jgi:TRAP-type C4-dicarboxylate transport system substrate-binding protein
MMTRQYMHGSGGGRSRMTRRAAFVAGTAALALTALVPQARAQQVINVTFIAGFPPAATFVGSFVNGYMQAVDAALAKSGKYKISWNLAHSGQIAKPRGEMEALQGGLGDIAAVPTPYYFDRVPMFEIPFVTPFTTYDPVFLSKVYKQLEAKFPQYHEVWAKYNQKLLVTTPNADAYVLVTQKPVKGLADLKGMKVACVGPNLRWLSHIGVTPVQGSMADWYTGLNTGLYQGAMSPPQAIGAFKLCQPAKYFLDAGLGANANVNLNVNLSNFWNKLPDEVKQVFIDAAPIYDSEQLRLLQEGSKTAIESCSKQYGMVVTKLPEAERLQWAKTMPNIAQEWAERVEQQGIPGKEILKFYMDAMRAGNQPVARHWDRE